MLYAAVVSLRLLPRSYFFQPRQRTLLRYRTFACYVVGEHLTTDGNIRTGTSELDESLPIPPLQEIVHLVLLLRVIQKIQHALVESFRVSRGIGSTKYRGRR